MIRLRLTHCLATLLFCTLVGCGGTSSTQLGEVGLQMLRSIEQTSSGSFQRSAIQLQVNEGGAIEVAIQGTITPKETTEGHDPEDAVWIPILLVPEMPEYYRIESSDGVSGVTLEPYRLRSGMWCLTAVVPPVTAGTSPGAGGLAIPLHLRVELVSKQFTHKLPILLPLSPSDRSVAVSIKLPKGGRFKASETMVNLKTSSGWTRQAESLEPELTIPKPLVRLPAAFSADHPAAAATFNSPDAVGLDLSGIEFAPPGVGGKLKPWFRWAALLIFSLATVAWLRTDHAAYVFARVARVYPLDRGRFERLAHRLGAVSTELESLLKTLGREGKASEGAWNTFMTLRLSLLENSSNPYKWSDPRELQHLLDTAFSLRAEIRMLDAQGHLGPEGVGQRVLARLDSLIEVARSLLQEVGRLGRRRDASSWSWLFWVVALLSTIALLAYAARAQGPAASKPQAVSSRIVLSDLSVRLIPHAPHDKSAEDVDVQLQFAALSADRKITRARIKIGTGGLPNVTFAHMPPPSDPNVTLASQGNTHVLLDVPALYSQALRRVIASMSWAQAAPLPDLARDIGQAKRVAFSYTLQKSAIPRLRWGRSSVSSFPFGGIDVNVAIELQQHALVWRVQLDKPSRNYQVTTPVVSGVLPASFSEGLTGDYYLFENQETTSRTAIRAGTTTSLRAHFYRDRVWARGSLIAILLVSILLGWISAKPDKSWVKALLPMLGFETVLATIYVVVMNANPDVPSFVTQSRTSIFELTVILGIVLAIGTFIAARKLSRR